RPEDALSPYASPLLAEPQGLPPALVITAEYDPLRDEGEMYVAHLRQHGVEAVATRYIGVAHGFINLYPMLEEGKMAISQIAAAITQKLAGK
nr:alpha/beta hydrolase fold domain-containing protein [Pyrobaculum sp.]